MKKEKNVKKGPITKLMEEFSQLKDDYLRALASYDNLRKRTDKEMERFRYETIEKVLKLFIPIIENLERALEAGKDIEEAKQFHKGVEMIYNQMKGILAELGVEQFESIGTEFDPAKHEAIAYEESEDKPGIIINELNKGYRLGDRIIIPSKVIVSKEKVKGGKENGKDNRH